jgi:rRNA maturation RNase YbeY
MPQRKIHYFREAIALRLPLPQKTITYWVEKIIEQEKYHLLHLSFIFCSDAYLHEKNVAYLQHDTLTDVITFNYAEQPKTIEGEIYISVERVRENAIHYQSLFKEELARVMIHGVLHLIGYKDETPAEERAMRTKEDNYILLLHDLFAKQQTISL